MGGSVTDAERPCQSPCRAGSLRRRAAGCRSQGPTTQRAGGWGWEPTGAVTTGLSAPPPQWPDREAAGLWITWAFPAPQPGSPVPPGKPRETRGAGRSGEAREGPRQVGVSRVDGEGRWRFPRASTVRAFLSELLHLQFCSRRLDMQRFGAMVGGHRD